MEGGSWCGAQPVTFVAALLLVTSSPRHGKLGAAPFTLCTLGFGFPSETKVSLTAISMEVEATRGEPVAIVTRAKGGDR